MGILKIERQRFDSSKAIFEAVFADERLSLKAKGLYMAMIAEPIAATYTETFTPYGLTGCKDGRDSIRGGLRELIECGYLEIKKHYSNETLSGHIEYEYIIK